VPLAKLFWPGLGCFGAVLLAEADAPAAEEMSRLVALFWPMVGFFGALVLAGAGAPIPEELPTITAGIWVASNPELGLTRWLALPVCFAGVLISDVMLYSIGRFWGPRLLQHRWVAKVVPADKRQQIEDNFHEHGVKILLLVRWLPGIRSPMFITAGIMRLPAIRFVIADGVAAVLGHSMLFFLAYWFGDSFRELLLKAEHEVQSIIRPLLVLAAISAVTAYLLYHFLRHPVTTGDPAEVPPVLNKVATLLEHKDCPDPADPECAEQHPVGSLERRRPQPLRRFGTAEGGSTKEEPGKGGG